MIKDDTNEYFYRINPIKTTRDTSRPQGFNEKNDCTVRALSNALEIPYISAYSLMLGVGRKANKGGRINILLAAYQEFPRPNMTVANYVKVFCFSGNWIIHVTGHVFAVINGVIIDQYPEWNLSKHVIRAWKIK